MVIPRPFQSINGIHTGCSSKRVQHGFGPATWMIFPVCQTSSDNHDYSTTIQPKPRYHPNDRFIKTLWHWIHTTSATAQGKMVSNTMWFRISNADTDTICHNQTGMHGHSMGYPEMCILPQGSTHIPDLD